MHRHNWIKLDTDYEPFSRERETRYACRCGRFKTVTYSGTKETHRKIARVEIEEANGQRKKKALRT